ncbi:hypothetical protein GH714_018603 [Hevea brasiliensis]|uniref:Uncharacterized protein n=1 Tax=Hevea brasiliensis TaxID=3981 RepID=A0A6A6MCD9_HEVBR|nr:hypothetical protein GH714_018603 [Hevea brasiliensis]
MKKDAEVEKKMKAVKDLEVEVVELRRKNKELKDEKRELTVKLDAAQAKITALSNMTEDLRHVNEDLLKQVEGLQMNRFSEVEELVYLRWVNVCLSSASRYSSLSKKPSLIQKIKKWGKIKDDSSALSSTARSRSPSRTSMSYQPRGPLEALMLRNAGDSVAITTFGKMEQDIPNSLKLSKCTTY